MAQREQIIEKATEIMVQHGVKALRMDDIVQSLGISKRTIYELFGDKEELLYQCLRHYSLRAAMEVEEYASKGSNSVEKILLAFGHVAIYSDERYQMMSGMHKFYPAVIERMRRENGELPGSEKLKVAIDRCIDEGYFDRKINIDMSISMLYYISFGVIARKDFMLPDNISAKEAFIYVVIWFFRGIATSKGLLVIDEFLEKHKDEKVK